LQKRFSVCVDIRTPAAVISRHSLSCVRRWVCFLHLRRLGLSFSSCVRPLLWLLSTRPRRRLLLLLLLHPMLTLI
jgi:hypothetical protein